MKLIKKVTLVLFVLLGSAFVPSCGASTTDSNNSIKVNINSIVIQAWVNAQIAFINAEKAPSNTNYLTLSKTMTDPELNLAIHNLQTLKEDDYQLEGSIQLGNARVKSISGTQAVVESCELDGGWFENLRTGKAVLGTSPGTLPFSDVSNMTLIGHTWKLASDKGSEGKGVCKYENS